MMIRLDRNDFAYVTFRTATNQGFTLWFKGNYIGGVSLNLRYCDPRWEEIACELIDELVSAKTPLDWRRFRVPIESVLLKEKALPWYKRAVKFLQDHRNEFLSK